MKRGLIDDYSLCVDVIVSFVFFYAILIIINCCLLRIPLIITHYANFFHSMQTKIFINIKIVQAFRHIQTFLIIVLCWTKLILRLVENKLFLWNMECRQINRIFYINFQRTSLIRKYFPATFIRKFNKLSELSWIYKKQP